MSVKGGTQVLNPLELYSVHVDLCLVVAVGLNQLYDNFVLVSIGLQSTCIRAVFQSVGKYL